MKEWCEEFNKTPEEYYKARREIFNVFCNLGGRRLN